MDGIRGIKLMDYITPYEGCETVAEVCRTGILPQTYRLML
jgi:hypothetical protein